jgi:5-methylcytosine-specific restriction enzyme A
MPKLLRSLPSLVRTVDTRTVKPLPSPRTFRQRLKKRDPIYASREFRLWRARVIARAGGRCEAVTHGYRCTKAEPADRLFADHVIELQDGGAPFDIANGQCLCGPHHLMKTAQARRDQGASVSMPARVQNASRW